MCRVRVCPWLSEAAAADAQMTTSRAKSMSAFLLPVIACWPTPCPPPFPGLLLLTRGQKDPGVLQIKTWKQRQQTKL